VTVPLLGERGHQLATPSSSQFDLFDVAQVRETVHDVHAVLHLATRIPTPNRRNLPGAWDVNDRLRADATRLLVDGALSANTELIVVPTAAFVYPPGPADESTPPAEGLSFCAPRWKLKPNFAASLTRDAAASHCGLVLCTDREQLRLCPPTATTCTYTLTTRVERWWPLSHALAASTTSAMTPTR
jgi:hypothetical protein